MKVLFQGKKPLVRLKGIVVLFVFQLSLLAMPAHSQVQDSGAWNNRKLLYGVHFGFTENKVDLYYTQGGAAHALDEGKHSFYAPGFRMAVIGDYRMRRWFSLRAMPGILLFSRNWEPTDVAVMASPSSSYKVESVCGELPVNVKFHPIRVGKMEPYLTSGLSYSFDFSSLRDDSGNETILQLNPNNLRYECGIGVDCDTRYIRLGVELKAGFGLLSPSTGGSNLTNPFYFHSGPTFSIGINLEA